jgi:hypothetical protein
MKRQADLFCGKIPKRDLDRFVESQPGNTLIAATRAGHPMNEGRRLLAVKRRPGFLPKDPLDLGFGRQRMKKRLEKAEPGGAGIGNELQRSYIHRVGTDLTVAYHAVAGELEPGYPKAVETHTD